MNAELKDKQNKVNWSCIHRRNQHEVGCSHKEWTADELLSALIVKKEFEQRNINA